MAKLLRIFLTGMFISFLGSLPLGTLNIATMQIAISDGVLPALKFSFGALVAEVIYVRLSLIAMDWIQRQQKLFRILEWVTVAIVAALAISSFYAALHPSVQKNVILSSTLHRFFLGLFMGALNPMQIPFWFGWSTVLFSKKILHPVNSHYNSYITGIGLGTLLGNFVFIFGGKLIAGTFNNNQHLVNWIVGGIFAITALVQLWKIFTKKDVQHRMEHPEEETKQFEERVEEISKTP
jgi:threonine/homoserine/homoserine lactone efflux protein